MPPIRKNYFINPHFQIRVIRFVAISCAAISIITLASQYFFIGWLLKALQDSNAIQPELAGDLKKISSQALIFTSVLVGFTFIVIMGLALSFSHKIAGPIFKMKKCMDSYIKGEQYYKINLRTGDYLVDLAEKINQVMDHKEKPTAAPKN